MLDFACGDVPSVFLTNYTYLIYANMRECTRLSLYTFLDFLKLLLIYLFSVF